MYGNFNIFKLRFLEVVYLCDIREKEILLCGLFFRLMFLLDREKEKFKEFIY